MTGNEDKSVTIYDIAALANVSVATVSRVINDTAPVKTETREKVERIIKETGFHPNIVAQSLSWKSTRSIAFILPDITNAYFSELFVEAEKVATELGRVLLLGNTMNDFSAEDKIINTFLDRQVDGIIIAGGRTHENLLSKENVDDLNKIAKRVPLIVINTIKPELDAWHIVVDEAVGAHELTEHLIKFGHRHFAFAGGAHNNYASEIKINAIKKSMHLHNIPESNLVFLDSGWTIDAGIETFNKLFASGKLPSAIMAVNDLQAIGMIKAAESHGLNIPNDISITGFDDIFWAAHSKPTLTTVNQNYKELGTQAIKIICADEKDRPSKEIIHIPCTTIIRESSAKAKN